MIVKYAIANATAWQLAHSAQDAGLSGSIVEGYGFGGWGVERTVFVEMAVDDPTKADEWIARMLWKHKQSCAYRTIDGVDGKLIYMDGRIEGIVTARVEV